MNKVLDLEDKAKLLRKLILRMAYEGRGIHISSSLSIADILTVLYWQKLRPKKQDRFILSKGHGVSALYAVLHQKGIISKADLASYGHDGTMLGGHPEHWVRGIEMSTGSLGHGISVGSGLALSAKLNRKDSKVFVLISDAECQEGSVWEAAIFASQHKLDNLVVMVDYNKLQAFGRTKTIGNLDPIDAKWKSFGWSAVEIDGNSISKIAKAFDQLPISNGKPTAIIAHTISGKGVSFMEDKLKWHYFNLNEKLFATAMAELNQV